MARVVFAFCTLPLYWISQIKIKLQLMFGIVFPGTVHSETVLEASHA